MKSLSMLQRWEIEAQILEEIDRKRQGGAGAKARPAPARHRAEK